MVLEVLSEECQAALAAIESYKADMRDICDSIRAIEKKASDLRGVQLLLIMEALLMMAITLVVGSIPWVGWVVVAALMVLITGLFVAAAILDRIISGLNSQISDLTKMLDEMQKTLVELQNRAREVCPERCIPNEARTRFICFNNGIQ